jgi:hypothetical protein
MRPRTTAFWAVASLPLEAAALRAGVPARMLAGLAKPTPWGSRIAAADLTAWCAERDRALEPLRTADRKR